MPTSHDSSRVAVRRPSWLAAAFTSAAALLTGCSSVSLSPSASRSAPDPAPDLMDYTTVARPGFTPAAPSSAQGAGMRYSSATTPRDYRKDAASHLYARNAERIYKGRMPPLLYAVGVLDVEVDGQGRVLGTHWKRAPSHAPEVMAEIERTVQDAAPYPAPARLGRVTYTDVWLWDESGRFQLDTLTEGQD